jgi:hypothetical protein
MDQEMDSGEDTPMVAGPKTKTRLVRIVSKQSNVWGILTLKRDIAYLVTFESGGWSEFIMNLIWWKLVIGEQFW